MNACRVTLRKFVYKKEVAIMADQDQVMTVRGYVQDYKDFEKYQGNYVIVQSWLKWLQGQYAGVITPGFYLQTEYNRNDTEFPTMLDIIRALNVPGLEKLCIYLALGTQYSGHANAIIVDLKRNEIWNFEPHGNYTANNIFIPQRAEIIDIVKTELKNSFPNRDFRVHGIEDLPFDGPQRRECRNDVCSIRIDKEQLKRETKGYCAAWTLMYIHYHAINPGMSGEEVNNLINTRFSPKDLYNRVRGYAGAIYRNFASEKAQKSVARPRFRKTAAKKAGRKAAKKTPKRTVARPRFRKTAGKKAGRKAAKKTPKRTVVKPRVKGRR